MSRLYSEKELREISGDRIRRCINVYERSQCQTEKAKRQEKEHKTMQEVIDFFEKVKPQGIEYPEEATLSHIKGTKSKGGMINLIDKYVSKEWPEWRIIAAKHFNVEYIL